MTNTDMITATIEKLIIADMESIVAEKQFRKEEFRSLIEELKPYAMYLRKGTFDITNYYGDVDRAIINLSLNASKFNTMSFGVPNVPDAVLIVYVKELRSHAKSIVALEKRRKLLKTAIWDNQQGKLFLRGFFNGIIHAIACGYEYRIKGLCTFKVIGKPVNYENMSFRTLMRKINWKETKLAKQEIIDSGKIPYNKQSNPDGEKYFKYYTDAYYFWLIITNKSTKIKNIRNFFFRPYKYNNYKNRTTDGVLEDFKTVEEICLSDKLGTINKLFLARKLDPLIEMNYDRSRLT